MSKAKKPSFCNAPRYLVLVSGSSTIQCETLADALVAADEHGGLVYEPLAASTAAKITAEPVYSHPDCIYNYCPYQDLEQSCDKTTSGCRHKIRKGE